MKSGKVANLLIVLALLLSTLSVTTAAAAAPAVPTAAAAPAGQGNLSDRVDPLILEELEKTGKADFFIVFKDSADLSPAYSMNWHDRGYFVVDTLKAMAERSQVDVRKWLAERGIRYTVFWINNSLFVHADEATLTALAAFPEIAGFEGNHVAKILAGEPEAERQATDQILAPSYPWNVTFPMADQVHSEFGIKGQGVVVGGMDTGVEYTHIGLVQNYRGCVNPPACTIFDHTYSWYDPSNACGGNPCDTDSHGTATMGIMAGDDDPSLPTGAWIGMAPDAQWIHCLGCPYGSCPDSATTACAQWFLAPGGDPNLRPRVVNHSWGTWSPNDCNGNAFQAELMAYRAADIVPAFAAGNVGDACNTSTSPANNTDPSGEPIAFASGAHGMDGSLDYYSSCGWNACNPTKLFPDVASPGLNSCTTGLGNSYNCAFGGTSSASPHTAGCVALVRSANPTLTVEQVEQVIRDAANDVDDTSCGGTIDWNNRFGEGYLDCYEAVQLAGVGGMGTIDGTVTDSSTSLPLEDATIDATLSPTRTWQTTTDDLGYYEMKVMTGTLMLEAWKYGYVPQVRSTTVYSGVTTTENFALDPAVMYTVDGTVTDATTGWPLYAYINIDGYPYGPVWTDPETGYYSVSLAEGVPYTFHVNAWVPGYLPAEAPVGPLTGDTTVNFALQVDQGACVAPGYELILNPYFADNFESGYGNWTMDGLWNPESQTDTCGSMVAPFPSPTNASYYGVDGTCTYNNGSTNSGSLTMSAPAALPAGSAAFLSFASYEQTECGGECYYDNRYVEISTDGGVSWIGLGEAANENVWYTASFDLSAYAGSNVQVRFRFDTVDSIGNDYFGWMVDDVAIQTGTCTPQPGGLVVGNTYDLNTSLPLLGVTVANDAGYSTVSVETPDDPAVDDGFYTLFSPPGDHLFTASKSMYGSTSLTVTVVLSSTVEQDFYLGTGELVADPTSIAVTIDMGVIQTEPLTLTNVGTAGAMFELQELDRGYSPALQGDVLPYTPPAASAEKAGSLSDLGQADVQGTAAPVTVQGDLLLDQQPNQVNGLFSDSGCELCGTGQQSIAENFYLAEGAAIGQIVFWTGYYPSDTPIDPDQLVVIFHEDAAGLPGAAIYTEADVAYERVQTGVVLFGVHEWMHTLTLGSPVTLDPGNYWVEIYNNTGLGNDSFFWETGDLDPVAGLAGSAWTTATPGQTWNYDSATNLSIQLITGGADVPWLSESPVSGTVPADGGQVVVDVTFDSTSVTQPGDYLATLGINNDTPYGPLQVPVTMTVVPPPTYGKLEGTVTGLGYCDADPAPLEEAEVIVEGSLGVSWTLATDEAGYYLIWLDQANSPLTIHVTYPEHEDGLATGVIVTGQQTTTVDFDLRWLQPCLSVTPDSLAAALDMGATETQQITLTNTGAAPAMFELQELDRGYSPGLQGDVLPYTPPAASAEKAGSLRDHGQADVQGAAAPVTVQGDLLLDQQPNQVNGLFSDSGCEMCGTGQQSIAENFYLAEGAAIGQIVFWTGYYPNDTPIDPDQLVVIFHEDAAGLPGAAIYTEADVAYERVQTGVVLFGVHEWMHTLTLGSPVTLDPGNYWVEIYNNTGLGNDSFFWETGDLDPVAGLAGSAWTTATPGQTWNYDSATNLSIQLITGGADVPWLSESPVSGTVPADGGQVVVDVTFDAGAVAQPGEYWATLNAKSNDPVNGTIGLPVTMTVAAPPDWGILEGTVTGMGHCDAESYPLEEATVVAADGGTMTVTTDINGEYVVWLEEGTYDVVVSADGHVGDSAEVTITSQQTTIQDFALRSIQPCMSLTPPALEATLLSGTSETQALTLINDGAGPSDFTIRETTRTVEILGLGPGFARASGHGKWLYRTEIGVEMETNGQGKQLAYPKAYHWQPDTSVAALNILIYADDVIHTAPNTFLDQALQALGLAYTAHYDGDWTGFETDLTSSTWDLVLVGNDNYGPPESTFTAMNNYVAGGGKLVFHGWTVSNYPSHPLWSTLGFTFVSNDTDPPAPVYWWDPSHLIFTNPEAVPEFTTLTSGIYGTYGQYVEPLAGLEVIAGYTTPGPDPNQAAMVLANDNRTVFKGFLDGQNSADLDIDSTLDGVELWINMIDGLQYGFAADVPWVSEDPITGTVPADDQLAVEVTFTALPTLTLGTYTATLIVKTDDSGTPEFHVPVTMNIVSCVEVAAVDLTMVTTGTILPGDAVDLEADIEPDDASKPYSYTVDYDDGTPPVTGSSSDDPLALTHTYADPGSYTVTISAWNCDMAEPVVDTVLVTVGCDPVSGLDFTWLPEMPIVGETVAFTATAEGTPPIAFDWDFDDGTLGAGMNVTHVYTAAGDYTVMVMATNCDGTYEVMTHTLTVGSGKTYLYLPIVYKNY